MITQDEVRYLFDYDESGWLVWKCGRSVGGHFAGTVKAKYIKITIDGIEYYAHRLIFLWHHGYMPEYIDHRDRNGFNNRIDNLREATQQQNVGNVDWGPMRGIEKHGRKWRVRISGSSWKRELGSYNTLEGAIAARDAGYQEYFGEFAWVIHG